MRVLAQLAALALVVAAVSALWWLETLRRTDDGDTGVDAPQHQPAAYFEQFRLRRHAGAGRPTHTLRGARLVRYADDDTTAIERPRLRYRPTDGAPWTIRAARGHLGADEDRLELTGDVRMVRRPGGRADLSVETTALTVFRAAGRARTDAPVRLRGPGWRTTAVGMQAFLERNRLHLQSDVWSRYTSAGQADNG